MHVAPYVLNELRLSPRIIKEKHVGSFYSYDQKDDDLIQLCVYGHLENSSVE